jgi:sigma-B regulation protein RsbU (phosphoserine phosphatase)
MIGLFAEWECSTAEVTLAPGDTLLVFSDGVTEALGPQGEEFGEGGLLAALRARAHLPLPLLAQGIASDARRFAGGDPADDLTLVVARCRPGACEALPGGRADGRAR